MGNNNITLCINVVWRRMLARLRGRGKAEWRISKDVCVRRWEPSQSFRPVRFYTKTPTTHTFCCWQSRQATNCNACRPNINELASDAHKCWPFTGLGGIYRSGVVSMTCEIDVRWDLCMSVEILRRRLMSSQSWCTLRTDWSNWMWSCSTLWSWRTNRTHLSALRTRPSATKWKGTNCHVHTQMHSCMNPILQDGLVQTDCTVLELMNMSANWVGYLIL